MANVLKLNTSNVAPRMVVGTDSSWSSLYADNPGLKVKAAVPSPPPLIHPIRSVGSVELPKSVKARKKMMRTVTFDDDGRLGFPTPPGTFDSFSCSFAFNSVRDSSTSAPSSYPRIPGLYAIVIPSGGGKSTMASALMQLDIDKVLPDAQEFALRRNRMDCYDAVSAGGSRTSWVKHNYTWGNLVHGALVLYDFTSEPRTIFCHSPEMAQYIGAELIGIFSPEQSLHAQALKNRGDVAKALGLDNRDRINLLYNGSPLFRKYFTHRELGILCARAMSRHMVVPNAHSFLSREEVKGILVRHGFNSPLPMELVAGDFSLSSINMIIKLVEQKALPKCYIQSWCDKYRDDIVLEFGSYASTYLWLHLGGSLIGSLKPSSPRKVVTLDSILTEDQDWHAIYPYVDSKTCQQASVGMRSFLRNYGPRNLDDYAIYLMNVHVGSHNTFMVGVLTYYLGVIALLPEALRRRIKTSGILEVPENKWVTVHSAVHNAVRAHCAFFGLEVSPQDQAKLQYTHLLIGRRGYVIDPLPELEKRSRDMLKTKQAYRGGWESDAYFELFRQGVVKAYSRLGMRKHESWSTFKEMYDKRYLWSTGGSITRVPDEFRGMKDAMNLVVEVDGQIRRISADPNKKMAMESMNSPIQLAHFVLSNWGFNDTSLATKPNEPAKSRVIIPGSFPHFVAVTFLLSNAERSGPVGGVRVGEPDDNNLTHYDLRMADMGYNFMLDFADHNAQHSVPEMILIMELLKGELCKTVLSKELEVFTSWVTDSFFKMDVRVGDERYHITSGLYSGWRNTTWINSVACDAYIYVGIECSKRLHEPIHINMFDAAGDDVMMRLVTPLTAIQLYLTIVKCGFKAQCNKQLFSSTMTEFLRLQTSHGSIRACLNRTLTNFICGDLERSSPSVIERSMSAYATTSMLKRRGLSTLATRALYSAYMGKWLRVRTPEGYVDVNRHRIHGTRESGGLGLPDEFGQVWILGRKLVIPTTPKVTIVAAPTYASRDYAEVMRKRLSAMSIQLHVGRYIDKLAAASFGKHLTYNTDSPEFFPSAPVIDRMEVRCKPNFKVLHDMLRDVASPAVKEYQRQYYRWKEHSSLVGCTNVTQKELLSRLGVTINVSEIESLFLPLSHTFMVPEYILYNLGLYVRSRVGMSVINATEAATEFMGAAEAYVIVYDGMML